MATFNLTAQLNLKGPTNVKQIAAQIKKDLGSLNANVQFKLDPAAAKNVSALASSLKTLNSNFATTVKSANSATAAIKAFGNSINSVKINNVPQQINQTSSAIAKLNKVSSSTSGGLQNAATEMQEFGKQAGLAVRRFVAFSAVTSVIYGVTNSINNGIQAFIDYDKELVKLQQVTGESAAGLSKLQSQIGNLAVEFGVSSKELTQVASTLAQAGLSARETEKALKALALSSLAPSFDNMNETVEGSIAIMRQFGISANDLEASLGAVNAVAARFAVESSDIITAVQRTGSVFATASKGVSEGKDALNEFISVFTSIRATSRESAETIATGLRTIFTRVQRGTTIDALKEFGVNLTDAEGKFVGAYKAVELLSKGLGKIDPRSLDFSRIVEELGGFRQIGKVIPLIQQFTVTQQALKVAQQGQASLAKDAATAQLSLANQISKVREEFFSLFREIGQSKGFQSLVRGALSLTSGLIKVADAVKGILPALAVLAAFKGFKALTEFTTGFATGVKRGPDGKANGGVIRKFARGGVVPGTGSGDTVPAMLEPGEFVIRKKAVETIGANNLHSMNKYGSGGSIRAGKSNKRQKFANGGRTPKPQNVIVNEVNDGDSLRVNFTPESESYQTSSRLVGVDTYESNSGPKWMKNLGKQAKAETAAYYKKNQTVTQDFIEGYKATGGKKDSRGRPFFKNDSLKSSLIDKGLGYAYMGGKKQQDISKTEYLLKFPDNKNIVNKKNLGGKIQKFAGGGKVLRNIGIIDTDVLRDAANAAVVRPAMEKLGITDVSDYTTRLGELAAKARKNKSLSKFIAIAGAAGSGKSSVATGKGANDNSSLRKTTRSQILTPEDIEKVSEVFILTSTASQTKLDSYLKDVDRAYILSSNNKDEQDQIRLNRDRRDATGAGLYGRKPGTTKGAVTDFALEETILRDELGKKATVLGRKKDSFGLRRKKENELPEIIQAGGFYTGGFAPPTRGHRGALDTLLDNMLSKNPKASLEDIVVSVAPDLPMIAGKEGIEHAARYGIFPADFRALLSKTNFGNTMISTQDQPPGSLPKFMEVAGGGDRRRFARLKGAMAITSGKEEGVLGKYARAGMAVKDIPRIEDISATKVRDALFSGDDKTLTSFLNPEVASILMGNRAQLRNRSTMVPMLIEEIQKFVDQDKARSNTEISELLASAPGGPYGNVNSKLKQNAPEIAGQIQDIRNQRDRVSRGAFGYRAFNIIRALSDKYPDMYGLDPSRKSSVSAKPSDVSKDIIAAQLSEQMGGEFGGIPTGVPSALEAAILQNVTKSTKVDKSSGILPAKAAEILKRLGGEIIPADPKFGDFAGKKVSDTAKGGKLPYWISKTDHLMMPSAKEMAYTSTRDYLINRFKQSQGTQKATALKDTTSAVLSSTQLGLVGLNPLGYTGLLGPETWNLGTDASGKDRSINASIVQRGLPTEFQNVIDYLSGQTAEIVQGASKLLGITPKELTKKQRETLGQGNIEGALLEQIFGSADATILDDALRTRPIDFPMGIGPKAAKIFGIDPNIPTEVKRTIDSGSRSKAVEEFQRHFRQQYGIPDPKDNKVVQKLSGGGLLKKYGEIFPGSNSTGPFKEMVFDFDDTLVTGGEIRLPDGRLDLSRKDDMPLVQEMLKKGKLTPLGQHLSEALKQEPSLIDNVSILSARNPNQAGILAQTLQNLGLPIPESKIRGSNGPQNKKITGYQKMIDDNLETITRLKGQGHEAIHYTFAKGGKVEEEYKSILASILPKEMLTSDGYLKMPSGQAEPIDFIPGRSLAEKSRSSMMSILLGKAEKAPPEEQTGAFYQGGLMPKVLRHNLEKYKDKLPEDEYKALKQFVNHRILFEGNDDTIKTAGGLHKGVLAHETFHDIQGYLYDNHPEIIDKLHESLLKRKDAVEKWYKDPKNAEWAGPKDYRLEHFFPTADTKSPYNNNLSVEAYSSVQKQLKRQPDDKIFKALGESQWDFGKNELVPVLLSAAVERNNGAIQLLSEAFSESGLNSDFYKTLPQKRKLGGVIRDIWHGTTTGKDDSVLESFKKYGAKSDVSSGFGQGQGFYVYSDPTSAMVRAMELEGGANYLTAADPNGKPMALKFTELLDGKNWDLDYEFQNADIVNFIHSHYDRVKEAVAKSRGVDLGTNLKDFSLDKKYDEYLDTTDNTMMRKVGISFKDQGKDAERLLANNNSGDARSGEVLSSLVKSLMHSDPEFYEEFETSFFNNLKPKQGLKYVGKDPLKPVLAQIFTRQKNIHDTGWITEKFAKGGQAGVSPQDTVPALLTPGEFVINKKAAQNIGYSKLEKLNKADKIQGYNKGGIVGGVQKFALGGGVDYFLSGLQSIASNLGKTQNITSNRPNSIDTSTIAVDPAILQDTKAFVDTLYDAGDGMKYLNRLLNENKQLSIQAVLEAGNKDVERLKISGASIDKIIEAEKALSNIRNKGLIDVNNRQFLESKFKESSVGKKLGSGATQQKILSLAEKEERRLIDKRKKAIEADIVSSSKQPISASDLADQVAQAISSELNDIKTKAFSRAATAATGTQTSTGIKGNITASELKNLNISGNDIQKYISDSMRDRKTLRQMDQQLIATRMEEYKNAGTIRGISVASAEEAKKLAQEEVSKRREAINDLAKMRGERGVGAAGLMDTRNSPINRAFKERYFTGNLGRSMQRGLGDVGLAAGLVAGQGQNISSALFDTKTDKGKIKAADAGARIDKAATTLSVGLTTSAQLAAINPMLGAAAAIGTALYAGADAAFDFSGTAKKAAQEMKRSLLNDKLSAASDSLSNALEKLGKDLNNVDLRAKTASAVKALTDTAIESTADTATAGKNKAENDRNWADFGRGILLGIGEIGVGMNPYYQDLDPVTLAKSKKGSYGMEEARVDAQKEAENYQKIANAGYGDLERLYAKGFSNDQIMDPSNQAGNIVRESLKGMILSDPEKLAQYMAAGPQGKEAIAGKAAQDEFLANDELAKAAQESARLARAMDLADKAGRRLAASFDKIADIVNESVNKISFESDARVEAANQYASSLRGESKVSGPKLREKNILDNPNAYSEAEFTKALESATAGLDAGLRKQLIGGAQLQQNIPKNITQSIATVLKTSASAGVDEAKKAAIDTAKNEIENNPNLSRQQKDELKQIATAKIENMAKKAKDNNADNTMQLSEFQKELEDGTNILGDFGKKLLDSVKNLSSFKEGALDKFAKGLNEASKAAKEAQNYFRKSRDISNEGNMNLREILSGYGETYSEKSNRIMGDVSNLAGGETTVQGIQNRQIRLSQQRDALQKQQGTLTDKDALRNNVEQLNKLDDQLQNNREALDMLANSTELVDKAFSDLQHTSELQNNRQNFVNQLLTNTPEEADKLNQSFIRLQRNLSGGLNSPYNQRDARKAFNEALFKTGNVREATRAGNTVLANQRKETLALSQDPGVRAAQELQIRNQYAQNQGKPGVDADQAVAEYFQKQQLQLTKQMAIESGMINNPLVQQSLAALQDRKTDPSMQKAAERYLEAVGLRSSATKAQGELALMESQSILKNSNDNLRISIDDLRASVEGNMRNANIGKDAAGNNIVNPGIAVAAPPVARSSGGLIYASNGKLIDFKPKGTDTVPAMLTPGEFVVNARSTSEHLPLLKSINAGYFAKGGLTKRQESYEQRDKRTIREAKEKEQQRKQEELDIIREGYEIRTRPLGAYTNKFEQFEGVYTDRTRKAPNPLTDPAYGFLDRTEKQDLARIIKQQKEGTYKPSVYDMQLLQDLKQRASLQSGSYWAKENVPNMTAGEHGQMLSYISGLESKIKSYNMNPKKSGRFSSIPDSEKAPKTWEGYVNLVPKLNRTDPDEPQQSFHGPYVPSKDKADAQSRNSRDAGISTGITVNGKSGPVDILPGPLVSDYHFMSEKERDQLSRIMKGQEDGSYQPTNEDIKFINSMRERVRSLVKKDYDPRAGFGKSTSDKDLYWRKYNFGETGNASNFFDALEKQTRNYYDDPRYDPSKHQSNTDIVGRGFETEGKFGTIKNRPGPLGLAIMTKKEQERVARIIREQEAGTYQPNEEDRVFASKLNQKAQSYRNPRTMEQYTAGDYGRGINFFEKLESQIKSYGKKKTEDKKAKPPSAKKSQDMSLADKAKGQLAYARQQQYLSRFRPEVREQKEKDLLGKGQLYYPDGSSPRGKVFTVEGSRSTQNVADLILPPPYKNVPNTTNPNTELLLPNPSGGMLNSSSGQLAKTQIAPPPQQAAKNEGQVRAAESVLNKEVNELTDEDIGILQQRASDPSDRGRLKALVKLRAAHTFGIGRFGRAGQTQPPATPAPSKVKVPDVEGQSPSPSDSLITLEDNENYPSPSNKTSWMEPIYVYIANHPEVQARTPLESIEKARAHLRKIGMTAAQANAQYDAAIATRTAEAPDFVDAKDLPFVKGVDVRPSEQQAQENARMMSDEQQKKKNDTIVKDREERLKDYEAKKVAMKLREKTIREYFGNDPEGKRRADKVIADLPLWDKTTAGRSADYNTKFDADIIQMGLYRGKSLTNWNRSDLISPDEAVYRYEAQVKRREDYMKGRAAGDFDKFDPSESPKVKGIMGWLTGKDKGEPTKVKGISTMSEPIKPDVKSVGTAPTSKDIKTDPVTFRPLSYSENDIAKLNSEVKDLETDLAFKSKDEYTKKLLEKKKGTLSAIQQATTQAMEVRAALNNQTESRYQELKQQANSGKISSSLEKEYIKLSLQRGVPYGQIRAFAGNISSVEDDMRRGVFSDAEMKQWSRQQRKEFESGLATEKETSFYDKVASELSDIARKNVDSSVTKLTGNKQLGQAAGLGAGFGTGVLTSVGNPSTTAVGVSTAGMGYLSSIGLQAAAGTTAAGLQYGAGQNEAAVQTLKDTATMAAINLGLRILTDPRSAKLLEKAKKEFAEGLSNPPSLKEFLNDPEMRELGKALGYTDLLETIKTGNAVDTTSMFPNVGAAVKGVGDALENIPTAGALRGTEYGFSGPGIPRAAPSKVTLGGTSTAGLTPPKTRAAAKVGSSVIEVSSLGGVNNITRLSTVDADAIMQARRGEIFENAVVAADEFSKMSPAAKKAFKEARAARKQNGPSSLKQPQKKANGGLIYAENGQLIDFSPKGTDTVPAMLTPGEFVVNAKSTKENLGLLHSINKSKGGPVNYLAKGGKSDKEQRSNDALSSYNSAASLEQISQNYKINEAMTDDGSSAASFMGAVTTGSANAREKDIAYQDAVIEQGKSAEAFALGAGTGGLQLGAGVAASYATGAGLTALAPFTGGVSLAVAPVVVPAVGALFGMAANKATNNVLEATGTKEYADSIKEASPLAYNVGSALPAVGAVGSQIASKGVQAFAGSAADRAFGATTGALSDAAVQVATQGEVKDWKSVALSATTGAIMPGKNVYEESQESRRLVGGTLSRAGEVTGSQTLLNAGGEMRFSPGDRARATAELANEIHKGSLYHGGAGWIPEGQHSSPILPRPSRGALGATTAISADDLAANPQLSVVGELAGDHMRMGSSILGHNSQGAYLGAVGSKSQAEVDSLAAQTVDYAFQASKKGSAVPSVLEVTPTDRGFVRKAINSNMHEPNPTLSANIGESLGVDPGSVTPIPHSNRVSQTTPADVLTAGVANQQQRIAQIRKTSGNAAANQAESMLPSMVGSSLPSAVSSPAYRTLGVPETQAPHWDINVPNPSATLGGSQSTTRGINLYKLSERNHGGHGFGQIAGHVGKHELPHLFGEHEPEYHSSGGLIYANNGALIKASGTDNVPAMLTEGEFVINKKDSKKHMPLLNAINSGYFNRGGIVNYLANGGIAGPQYLAAGGLGSISNSNISILPELLNKLSNMGMNSSGGTSQLAPISNVVQTLKQTASSSGGVSNNVSIDTANIASSIQDAVTNAIGQFNEYTEQIGANFTEQFNSAQKSLSSSIDTFQTATAQFGEHANAIPTSLSANVTQTTSLHHIGLDSIKGNMEQKIYDQTSINAKNISQDSHMQYDKTVFEGGMNSAAKQSIIGRTA